MKTKVKLIIAISLIAALFIGFMIGISVEYPNPRKSDLAGTFGKAEKFRKVQMTEKDLQLRSDLVKDTAKLRNMIQGLVYFSMFTEELRTNLDLCTISFSAQGMGTQVGESDKIKVMKDYSDFIRNNNSSLNSTIVMLSSFYGKNGGDASQDVERTLQDFGNYVSNMNKKDSILSQVLVGIDDYLLNSKTLQARETEFKQLKSIRDQLLVKGIQLGGLLGSKGVVVSRIKYAMDTQLKFNGVMNSTVHAFAANQNFGALNKSLGNVSMQSKLEVQLEGFNNAQVSSKLEGFNNAQVSSKLEGFNNAQVSSKLESNIGSIVYDKASLQFGVLNNAGIQALKQSLGAADQMGRVTINQSLNLKSGAMDAALLNSKDLNSFGVQSLGMIRANGDLSVVLNQFSVGQMVSSNIMTGISMDASLQLLQLGAMNSALSVNGSLGVLSPLNIVMSSLGVALQAN